jgi:hypothetical protein
MGCGDFDEATPKTSRAAAQTGSSPSQELFGSSRKKGSAIGKSERTSRARLRLRDADIQWLRFIQKLRRTSRRLFGVARAGLGHDSPLRGRVLVGRNLAPPSQAFGRSKKPWRSAACRSESYPSRWGTSQRRSPSASRMARWLGLS